MNSGTFGKVVVLVLLAAVSVTSVYAGQGSTSRGSGLYGDYNVKMKFGEREFESILSFSRNAEGERTGSWISFWGVNELTDLAFEEGKLTFTQTMPGRDGQTSTSKFVGTLAEGKLAGTMTSDRGETAITGQRAARTSRAVGNWQMKFKAGDRDVTCALAVKADKEGELSAEWQSEYGEHEITDLTYERGELSFKRKSKFGDRELESTFAGTVERDGLTGKIKSERGEVDATGTLIGASAIGTWNLDLASEGGARKQRLRVNSDMTGLYGSLAIKKVNVEDNKITFKIVMQFGDQTFESNFAGEIAEGKLAGEMKTSRGTSKVTGKKVVRTFGRRPQQ